MQQMQQTQSTVYSLDAKQSIIATVMNGQLSALLIQALFAIAIQQENKYCLMLCPVSGRPAAAAALVI